MMHGNRGRGAPVSVFRRLSGSIRPDSVSTGSALGRVFMVHPLHLQFCARRRKLSANAGKNRFRAIRPKLGFHRQDGAIESKPDRVAAGAACGASLHPRRLCPDCQDAENRSRDVRWYFQTDLELRRYRQPFAVINWRRERLPRKIDHPCHPGNRGRSSRVRGDFRLRNLDCRLLL
jgi:hypothetical protein